MTRTMYDSINAAGIPAGAAMVAGYKDGRWPSYDAMVARFPGAVHVGISVVASHHDGDVLDVETGDATPDQAPGWVLSRRAAGVQRPCCYVNRSNLGAVDQALHNAGVPGGSGAACLWVATLDGTEDTGSSPHGYAIVACQTADHGGYDESTVFDDTWPATAPPPAPVDYPEDVMQMRVGVVQLVGGRGWFKLPGDVAAGKVFSAVVFDQSPDAVGRYVPVPAFAGLATDRGELVFGNGPDGPTADGVYGFAYWIATG